MMKIDTIFRAWLDEAMPHRQGSSLGKGESVQSDAQGYRCSLSLFDAQSLEESGGKLEDVAINALWLDGKPQGGDWGMPKDLCGEKSRQPASRP